MAVKKARSAWQLKVTLKGVRPAVWRRIVVPARFDLEELHWVIQVARCSSRRITRIERGETYPRCLGCRRRCAPQDCGGPWGYAEMLAAIADVAHERHREFAEWISADFDPEAFDLKAVNEALDAVTRD